MAQVLSPEQNATPAVITPLPLSFPALLLNPKSRLGQLQRKEYAPRDSKSSTLIVKAQGKRKVLRTDNSKFFGNSHIVPPTRKDFEIPHKDVRPTFPKPLPSYLPRTSSVPSGTSLVLSSDNINSAIAGRFTLSIRGMRRELRQKGGQRARSLAQDVEDAIKAWLDGINIPPPGEPNSRKPIDQGETPSILQVSCTQMEMVWKIEDSFARWIVHCVSRWHNVVSFSKDIPVSGEDAALQRYTYLLRPNSRHPDPRALAALHTPTTTDIDSSVFDTEGSDFGDLADSVSSLQLIDSIPATSALSVVAEDTTLNGEESDFAIQEEDLDDGRSIMSSFSFIEAPGDTQQTPGEAVARERPLRRLDATLNANAGRSESSPSRSPLGVRKTRHARRLATFSNQRRARVLHPTEKPASFVAYVFGT